MLMVAHEGKNTGSGFAIILLICPLRFWPSTYFRNSRDVRRPQPIENINKIIPPTASVVGCEAIERWPLLFYQAPFETENLCLYRRIQPVLRSGKRYAV